MPSCCAIWNMVFSAASTAAGSARSVAGSARWRSTFITDTLCMAAPAPWPDTSTR